MNKFSLPIAATVWLASLPLAWAQPAPKWLEADQSQSGIAVLAKIEERDAEIVHAGGTSPFVAVGGKVLDLRTGQQIHAFDRGKKLPLQHLALSHDGAMFAREQIENNVNFVEVVDCATGQVTQSLRYTANPFKRVKTLLFTPHNNLVALVDHDTRGARALVYRAAEGRMLKDIPFPDSIDGEKVAFSDDGRLLAAVQNGAVEIHDLVTGEVVTRFDAPPVDKPFNSLIFLRSLRFSPAGNELAAFVNVDGFRLVIWDLKRGLVVNRALGLQIGGAYNRGPGIEWAPDGTGWLLHGKYYYDRELHAVAWILQTPVQHNYHYRWLDSTHMVATQGDFQNRELVAVRVPRETIAAAAKEVAAAIAAGNAGPPLKPGDPVQLEIVVKNTRFAAPQQVADALRDTLVKRLEYGSLVAADQGAIQLSVSYAEEQGSELRVTEGRGPRGRDTGQRVQETVVVLDAKLTRDGKTIWERSLKKGNPHFIRSEVVNDEAVRKATFDMLEYVLSSMAIPYFVPSDPRGTSLPMIVAVPGAQ